MKPCPKCQTKNQESSLFCKKCGSELSGSSFQEKKEKVLGEKKGKWPLKLISLSIIALALGGLAYWLIQGQTAAGPRVSSQPKVNANVNYSGQKISMTDVEAKLENGKISIPVETVLEKKIVRFEHGVNGVKIPLVSYVTQSGKIITAVSMCEPCRSTRFRIEGKNLVCNACNTEWDLESLKGITGGCLNYPPDILPSSIENGRIQIEEKAVTQWKPRV